jgi:hypothetical protein
MHLAQNHLYRLIAVAGFLAVVALVILVPDNFKEPDDWAYYYATQNISHGRLTVDSTVHQQQVSEAQKQGGQLIQYIQLQANKWGFEKAPGYVYFLVPFYLAGIPQGANVLLAMGLAIVTYLVLKRLKDEKAACIGTLLVLFTPVSLAMLQREYMDGFASMVFPAIGGGLYIYYCLRAESYSTSTRAILLLLSGFFLSGAVAVRYTDAVIPFVFALHFFITRINLIRLGKWSRVWQEAVPISLGAAVPLALLLWYHQAVFGSPFEYGYQYTKMNVKFAYDYLGEPRFWQIIAANIRKLWAPLLFDFPLLMAAIPGMVIGFWQKIAVRIKFLHRFSKNDWWPELKPDILLLLLGWFVAVFGLYVMYEWTANQNMAERPFIIVTRFYLPALLPLSIFAALLISKIPGKLAVILMAVLAVAGSLLFIESSTRDLKAGAPAPLPKTPPPGQVIPADLAGLIERTRREVKATPTTQANMKPRLDVLVRWIGELSKQGYPVGRVMPPTEVNRINNLIVSGNIAEACRSIDESYAKLEKMVISGPGMFP